MAGFGNRIEELAQDVGGKKKLSEIVGIHETQVYRWISETGLPSASGIVLLSEVCGVRLEWLANGVGPKWRNEADAAPPSDESSSRNRALAGDQPTYTRDDTLSPPAPPNARQRVPSDLLPEGYDLEDLVDLELLTVVVGGLEKIIEFEGRPMEYGLKAELILALYDNYKCDDDSDWGLTETAKVINIFNKVRNNPHAGKRGNADEPREQQDDQAVQPIQTPQSQRG